MQDKITAAIAGVIEKKGTNDFGMLPWCKPDDLICEITAAIMPLVEGVEKPEWSDAPEWANFLGRDSSGYWYWYENEPDCNKVSGLWVHEGRNYKKHFKQIENWKETLQRRPE